MSRKGAFCDHWSSAFPLLVLLPLADGPTASHEGWWYRTDLPPTLNLHLIERYDHQTQQVGRGDQDVQTV
jgi:hypothetical protein